MSSRDGLEPNSDTPALWGLEARGRRGVHQPLDPVGPGLNPPWQAAWHSRPSTANLRARWPAGQARGVRVTEPFVYGPWPEAKNLPGAGRRSGKVAPLQAGWSPLRSPRHF